MKDERFVWLEWACCIYKVVIFPGRRLILNCGQGSLDGEGEGGVAEVLPDFWERLNGRLKAI